MVVTPHSDTSIVFFGSGPVAAASLEFLARLFEIEFVVTKPTPAHHTQPAPVEVLANTLGLKIRFASNQTEVNTLFTSLTFNSRVGVIIDYGVIISQTVIDRFALGIVNSHFSLLPEWRGADPITFSILSGQKKTGVSLMLIEAGLDTGKLIAQKSLPIANDTTPVLTDRLIELSDQLLADYLPKYMAGKVKPRQQPHPTRATYSRKLTKADGTIDWHKPAAQIEREIRAFANWPQSHTKLGNVEVIIIKAHVISAARSVPSEIKLDDGRLLIGSTDGYLAIDTIKPLGKKEMPVRAFLAGYKARLS